MPYSQEVSRANKALFVFVLDQSYSMEELLGGSTNRKMDELCTAVNSWLNELVIRSTGSEGIRDYFDVSMIGYRTDAEENPIIESPLTGNLKDRMLVSIVDLCNNTRIEKSIRRYCDEETGEEHQREVEIPAWIEPKAEGGAPMCLALHRAYKIVEKWIGEHPRSFPPIVIHITDGENTGPGDTLDYAEALKSLATEDGNVLLFNCHLSETKAKPFVFPHCDEILPNDHARVLFHMSSILPESSYARAVKCDFDLQYGARGMVFNANAIALNQFLHVPQFRDLGTRAARGYEREIPCLRSELREPQKPPRVAAESKGQRFDENVQFTVYRPGAIDSHRWFRLLAFAHLSGRPPDAPATDPDPVEEVKRQAQQVLGEEAKQYHPVTQDSSQAVPREGELTLVPEIGGVEFNPPQRSFHWVESVHREEFRMRAAPYLVGKTARGRLTVFMESIVLADIPLAIRVEAQVTSQQSTPTPVSTAAYRRIFASYSHRDAWIVRQLDRYAKSLGDKYIGDWIDLRAGEIWSERLRNLIDQADIFQLFWSSNSMRSTFVRQEWEYALSLARNRPGFVRPTYWETPLPEDRHAGLPPDVLARLHFQLLPIRETSHNDEDNPRVDTDAVERGDGLAGTSELELPEEAGDDQVLGDSSDMSVSSESSGINIIRPSESGLALDEVPLEVGEEECGGAEPFALTPFGEDAAEEEEDSSQVIPLDEVSDDETLLGASPRPAEVMGEDYAAVPSGRVLYGPFEPTSRGRRLTLTTLFGVSIVAFVSGMLATWSYTRRFSITALPPPANSAQQDSTLPSESDAKRSSELQIPEDESDSSAANKYIAPEDDFPIERDRSRLEETTIDSGEPQKQPDDFRHTPSQPSPPQSTSLEASQSEEVAPYTPTEAKKVKARQWKNPQGRQITATYLGYRDSKVGLLRSDGKEFWVPLDRLTDADRRFVFEQETLSKLEDGEKPALEMRLWSDDRGTHQTTAAMVNTKNDRVTLLKSDGSIIVVAINRLSEEDRQYIGGAMGGP